MENRKIEPCPFCGHNKVVVTSHISQSGKDYVKANCRSCTASVWVWGTDKEKAIDLWNRRA